MVAVRRDTGQKIEVQRKTAVEEIKGILDKMQKEMLERARQVYYSRIKRCQDWKGFMDALSAKCVTLCPWCNKNECEENIKKRSKADSLTVG